MSKLIIDILERKRIKNTYGFSMECSCFQRKRIFFMRNASIG